MIKKIMASVVLLGCVTSGVHAQQSFGHWAVMQCQPVQVRLAFTISEVSSMSPIEQSEIIERSQTLEIIAQNYKYRLEELQDQIDVLNQKAKYADNLIIEMQHQNSVGYAARSELLQSRLLLLDTESRLISVESELKREKGYQKLVEEYCKKQTN